jgi:hypothetical protein
MPSNITPPPVIKTTLKTGQGPAGPRGLQGEKGDPGDGEVLIDDLELPFNPVLNFENALA